MRKVGWLILLIVSFALFCPMARVSAATASGTSAYSWNSLQNGFTGVLKGFLASTTQLGVAKPAPEPSEGIFNRVNRWFKDIAGIGLDQILLAILRLCLWLIKAMFGLVWSILTWIMNGLS